MRCLLCRTVRQRKFVWPSNRGMFVFFGVTKSRFTGQKWYYAGSEIFLLGGAVAALAYFIGWFIGSVILAGKGETGAFIDLKIFVRVMVPHAMLRKMCVCVCVCVDFFIKCACVQECGFIFTTSSTKY